MNRREYAVFAAILLVGPLVVAAVEALERGPGRVTACSCPAPATDRSGSDWAVEWAGVLP